MPAPSVLVFDKAGNLLQSCGGPGDPGFLEKKCREQDGCVWPARERGIYVDQNDFVYIARNGQARNFHGQYPWAPNFGNDSHVLKFKIDGTFVLQIGRAGSKRPNSNDTNGGVNGTPEPYWPAEQVDWFEAQVKVGGVMRKLQFFAMCSMSSVGAFHRAYTNATQQAFLEAHGHAFAYFGGVFRTLRYDNLGSAVKKILRGYRREETERMIAFRSHWGFTSEYCNPARGNEKGGVEGELGWFRRNWLVPVPDADDLAKFNAWLLTCCAESQQHLRRLFVIVLDNAVKYTANSGRVEISITEAGDSLWG